MKTKLYSRIQIIALLTPQDSTFTFRQVVRSHLFGSNLMMISMRSDPASHRQSFDRIAQILNIQLLTIKTMKLHSLLLLPTISLLAAS
jgi:hypothetical protein